MGTGNLGAGFVAAAAALLLAATGGCAGRQPAGDVVPVEAPAPPADGKVQVGEGYFAFEARDLDGETVRLSDLVASSRAVLLQFWGIRCSPCLAEMATLTRLQDRYGSRGLRVLGVNTDRVPAADLKRALAARGLAPSYPTVLDPDFQISAHYTQWLIPVAVLIDRHGVVREVHTGYRPEMDDQLVDAIEKVLR